MVLLHPFAETLIACYVILGDISQRVNLSRIPSGTIACGGLCTWCGPEYVRICYEGLSGKEIPSTSLDFVVEFRCHTYKKISV